MRSWILVRIRIDPTRQHATDYTPTRPSTSEREGTFKSSIRHAIDGANAARNRHAVLRSEKTDAIAKRMICGAVRIKPPKKSAEQKAYEKAMREKEAKRRDQEKKRLRLEQEKSTGGQRLLFKDYQTIVWNMGTVGVRPLLVYCKPIFRCQEYQTAFAQHPPSSISNVATTLALAPSLPNCQICTNPTELSVNAMN
jgi:hypothetical protein